MIAQFSGGLCGAMIASCQTWTVPDMSVPAGAWWREAFCLVLGAFFIATFYLIITDPRTNIVDDLIMRAIMTCGAIFVGM